MLELRSYSSIGEEHTRRGGFFSSPARGGALHLAYSETIDKFAGKKGNGEIILFGFVPFGVA
ncbi:MAG: hypothetical protein KAW16_02700 [candidate division Zixibacteria bacterium]|nr:hypothetical protein [candidate division Zixibacteria bacterium]